MIAFVLLALEDLDSRGFKADPWSAVSRQTSLALRMTWSSIVLSFESPGSPGLFTIWNRGHFALELDWLYRNKTKTFA
jgi:hypothetical protein